ESFTERVGRDWGQLRPSKSRWSFLRTWIGCAELRYDVILGDRLFITSSTQRSRDQSRGHENERLLGTLSAGGGGLRECAFGATDKTDKMDFRQFCQQRAKSL